MLISSLQVLSQLLYKHFGKKAIILIDEYDVPLDKAFQNGYYREMVSLIRGLFGMALKTNDSLQFAVLTGCMRISKESIFTGLNNFEVLSILNDQYDELDKNIENLWSVLFTTGYLTHNGHTESGKYRLVIPNKEVRNLFVKKIRE